VTRVGYCGGTVEDPSYRKVCGDPAYSDWAECVQVEFNDAQLSYEELCRVFFKSHEPSMGSPKRQYMSAIFAHSEEQYETAQQVLHAVKQSKTRVSTQVSMPTLHTRIHAHAPTICVPEGLSLRVLAQNAPVPWIVTT
jgi:peptide methionine sulfoxide reductase MsrA